jgi:hypothetical protein
MAHAPTPKRGFDRLLVVTAIPPNDVCAVGDSHNPARFPAKSAHNVSMHWDGAAWTLVPAPTGHFAHCEQVDTSLKPSAPSARVRCGSSATALKPTTHVQLACWKRQGEDAPVENRGEHELNASPTAAAW